VYRATAGWVTTRPAERVHIFLDAAGKLSGNAIAPMGQGEFVLRTPRGIIGFDPKLGVRDKVGFTYLLSGFPEVITPLLEAMGIGELAAEPEPAAPVKRPMGEYKKLPQTGTWGIAVPGLAPNPGEKITVTTRKGKVKTEVVDRVVGAGYTSTGLPATLCSVVE
jgi:hypothetical protein